MGGLGRPMPVTFATMTVGAASALAGVPPLAGFFSKESVLSRPRTARPAAVAGVASWVGWLVLVAAWRRSR